MTITQGHRYTENGCAVLALESGEGAVRVAEIDHESPYPLKEPKWSHARLLKPAAMRYFHGETPE